MLHQVTKLFIFLTLELHSSQAQHHHFFGPPAIGFGVGLLSVHRRFPVATSIVSRRASRSYSHQYHYQATPFGSNGYQTSRLYLTSPKIQSIYRYFHGRPNPLKAKIYVCLPTSRLLVVLDVRSLLNVVFNENTST